MTAPPDAAPRAAPVGARPGTTATVAAPPAPPAAPSAPPGPRGRRRPPRWRPPSRTATCVLLTLAGFAVAVGVPDPVRAPAAAALAALVVGWGGLPLHRAAGRALRAGGPIAEVLPAAGLVAAFAAACAAGAPPLPSILAAAATTALLVGHDLVARVRRRADVALGTPDRDPGAGTAGAGTAGPEAAAPPRVVAVVDGRDAVASSHAAARDPDGDAVAQAARHGAAVLEAVVARAAARSAWLVAGLAVATLGFWLGAGAGPAAALGAAAAVLLVACPAAVGGAAATVLLAATARAVALGARPAGPRVLERAARVDTVVLCRSAVVGARRVDAVHAAAGVDPDEALRLAGATSAAALGAATGTTAGTATAAAAPGSGPAGGHPVDAAVAREARARCGALPDVAEPDGYPGLGVRGVVTELRTGPDDAPRVIAHATLVGRVALLADHGIVLPPELTDAVERVHRAGATAVAVSWDGVARAVLEVAAPVRAGLPAAVRRLRGLGIAPVLLTGDDEGAAHGLATQLGIAEDDVRAQVRREDRAAVVAALRARGRTVAVVGGPDDTAALAAADVALVERPAGETPGGETQPGDTQPGDTQPGDTRPGETRPGETRPHVALETLCLSHRAAGTVERVLTAAVAHHLAALPLAAAGLLPPPAAAALAAVHPVVLVVWAAGLRRAPRRGGRRNAD